MTTYEHMMLSICFGATMGWMLAGIGLAVAQFIGFIKDKIKARREKKQSTDTVANEE